MAILTSGITGPAAGKCAGVQFFKARSIPIVVIATFANHNTNPTKRDPLSIMTPQT